MRLHTLRPPAAHHEIFRAGRPGRDLGIISRRASSARDAHRVAGGELLPPVLFAAVLGPLLGVLLVEFCFGPLALRLLTGQSEDPATVVPWWILAFTPVVLLLGLVAVVAADRNCDRQVVTAGPGWSETHWRRRTR